MCTELVCIHSLLNHDQRGKLVSEGKNRYQLMKVEEVEEGGGGEKNHLRWQVVSGQFLTQ